MATSQGEGMTPEAKKLGNSRFETVREHLAVAAVQGLLAGVKLHEMTLPELKMISREMPKIAVAIADGALEALAIERPKFSDPIIGPEGMGHYKEN